MTTRFRLLDDFQASYLKFDGREPRTLEELAVAKANNEHRRRMAEIKAMSKKLALLDEFLPALAERGIKFAYRSIGTIDAKALRIDTASYALQDDQLFAALLELGFREVERSSYSPRSEQEQVTLKHGRSLLVKLDVTKSRTPPAPTADAAPAGPTTNAEPC